MANKKAIILKVAGRKIKIVLQRINQKTIGNTVLDEEEIRISSRTSGGNKRSLPDKFATFLHEVGHLCSMLSGHEIFEDDDKKLEKQKEHSLDAFSEFQAQIFLDNGMIDKDWLERFDNLDEKEDDS